jgi:hypothetical protein
LLLAGRVEGEETEREQEQSPEPNQQGWIKSIEVVCVLD